MQQKIERLQAQLGDLKGKSKDTSCVSDTRNPLFQKLESKNVELEFQVLNYARENAHLKATYKNLFDFISVSRTQTKTIITSLQNELQSTIYRNAKLRTQLFKKVSDQKDNTHDTSVNTKFAKQSIMENLPKIDETHALSKPVTSNSVSTPQESKVMKNDKVIAPGMFRIYPFKNSREEKHMSNNVSVIQICLWCVDSGCSKHMIGNLKLLINFVWKFMGTVRFGKDHVAAILGFGQFCDSDLQVVFRRNACFVRNLEGVDLLKGYRSTNLYTINLHEMDSASPICLMARASSTKKSDISFLHVFGALCYPKNDLEDIGKLGTKGDIGFFIGYSADSCAYRIYNRRTKKIMETMNVSFNELSAMAFEQRSSKPRLQGELDLLFEAMYDDYIGGQPSATTRTVPPVQEPQVRQTSTASTTIVDTAPTLTNSSSHATNIPITSHDVNELNPNAMFDEPKNVNEAMTDPTWIESMQEELLHFKRLDDSGFELTGFSDADYAGCKDTFKSTFGGAQFLGEKLVSWSLKKQDCTVLSTAEAEYVSISACCAQVLWMQTQLTDYGFHFNKIPIYCDSKSAIAISYNPVQHSRTKHIAVRYHFIKEHIEKDLKLLTKNDLKGTRTESGFKRAFATLFCQDVETFTSTMFLNMDQLDKQLDKEEFQEIGSMVAFKVLETQFQMFIESQIYLDDEYVVMTHNYFLQYTQLETPEFHDTLIQHMEYVKKSIDKRALHKREYESWVNERQMQTIEEKFDKSKALDSSLVDTESSGTESKEQDTSSRSGNDAHVDDVDIRPIYDEEPMAEVQITAEINVFAIGQQHTEQPEFNNEGEVDQNDEQCHDTCTLPAKLTNNQKTELSYQSLESENICLKKTVA
nr:retrovirus-related Pol polyprotein from transposon TNT 1-94 [Tanacetum cinerariifolium]